MMAPVVPFSLKGIVWYQGEQNIGRGLRYGDLLHFFWTDLRSKFEQPDLPILYVQLPNLTTNGADRPEWAILRQSQANAQKDPNAYMAVAIDQGLPGDIHPPDKRELARRISLLARREIYGETDLVDRGPQLTGAKKSGSALLLSFSSPVQLREPKTEGKTFEVAGEDKKFEPAQAKLVESGEVQLQSTNVNNPRYVRYLWSNAPATVLYGANDLPTPPFEVEVGLP